MYEAVLAALEAALLKRNPGIGASLQAGVGAEVVRKELKKAGVRGEVGPVAALWGWHNGALLKGEGETYRRGFAPPVVFPLPEDRIAFLRGLGVKVEPGQMVYWPFHFNGVEGAVTSLKIWKKFAGKLPRCAMLAGRFVPFVQHEGQSLALDTDAGAGGRIVSIQEERMQGEPPLREAYASMEAFLVDAVRANERNEMLTWPGVKGLAIEVEVPVVEAKAKKGEIHVGAEVAVVRVDYSDEAAWERMKETLRGAGDGVALDFVSEEGLQGKTAKQVAKLLPEAYQHSFLVVVDGAGIQGTEGTVLVVDMLEKPGRAFRTTPAAFGEVHANLSTANMDFEEFAGAVGRDGVFRGFTE